MYGIIQALIPTLTRELKISYTSEILTSDFTHWCQTRIGIGVTSHASHLAIGLILESEVTVIIDQYQCVKADCRYLQSIGDLKFSRKSV